MRDLDFNAAEMVPWFVEDRDTPYVLVRVPNEHVLAWPEVLADAIRRCYIDDQDLAQQAERTGREPTEIIASVLPDLGSVMAGDFGEIVVFLYHAALEQPSELIGPKKWRLKQDRTKPAPYSDVVHFSVPNWPDSSELDRILCSEVKTKATASRWRPIPSAIADCKKDRTNRLAKTLVWLRDRAMTEDLESTSIELLERFIRATDHPEAQKEFRAVAVICENLLEAELADAPDQEPHDYKVVVISIPDLKLLYEAMFTAVHTSREEQ